MKKKSDFVHLHVHSHFSLLDGACRFEELIRETKKHGMPALAVTDHGNLFGAIEFYKTALAAGIKPILGCEAYIAPNSRFKKESKSISEAAFHLLLLVKNEKGYKNLIKLVTAAYMEGFYYRPRIDKEILSQHSEGLIATSGCLSSEICHYLMRDQTDRAEKSLGEYVDIFGKDNFYIEYMDHGISEQKKVNQALRKMESRMGLKPIATNDVHYMHREDAKAHDALLCINTGKLMSDKDRLKFPAEEFYFKAPNVMIWATFSLPYFCFT